MIFDKKLEKDFPYSVDAVSVFHIMGESMIVVAGEAPRVVVRIKTFVIDAETKFKFCFVRYGIGYGGIVQISEGCAIEHSYTYKDTGTHTMT